VLKKINTQKTKDLIF